MKLNETSLYDLYDKPEELEHYKQRHKVPGLAYKEAMRKLREEGKRDPELEAVMMKDPKTAIKYAIQGTGKRWKEAEPIIMKSPFEAYQYARYIVYDRWPEAERYIMKDPKAAYWYAINLLGGKRWTQAEPYIAKDPEYASMYAFDVLKKRWPKAEPTIANSDWKKYYENLFNVELD